ncbi:MAG: hypothetical protein ABJQ70_14135 [Roseobacter sp.]
MRRLNIRRNSKKIETDAKAAEQKDRAAQQALVIKHLAERQALLRDGQNQGLSVAFHTKARTDPRQSLVLQDDGLPYSKAQLVKSPELVRDHISQTRASFKWVEVLRALAQKIDDPMVLQQAPDRAMTSSQPVCLPDDGTAPVFATQGHQNAERDFNRATRSKRKTPRCTAHSVAS